MTMRLGLLLTLLVIATAALTPLLGVPVYGRNFGHDANFALTALNFMESGIREGRWWPRWVMETNFGLGGITFYTYPPMGYWVAAGVRIVSGLPVADSMALTMALWRLVFLGGCFLWLRRHVPPAAALAAAALAALLPYPAMVNPWIRFSYAEVAGAAMLPFLLLAIERAAESRDGRGIPGLAVVFGALAMTHLPSCALVAHIAPIYGWAYGGQARGAADHRGRHRRRWPGRLLHPAGGGAAEGRQFRRRCALAKEPDVLRPAGRHLGLGGIPADRLGGRLGRGAWR